MRIQFPIFLIGLSMILPLQAADGVKKFERNKFDVRDITMPAYSPGQLPSAAPERAPYAKSKKLAFFYSLIMPGLGELYQNDWKFNGWGSGLYYFAAETFLWSGHFYLKSYSNWQRENSRSLAARSAGVDLFSPKPAKYYLNIGKFSDIYRYNEFQRRLVGTSTLYPETQINFWKWDSEKNRRKYDRLRTRTDAYRNYSQYMFWGIFTNHVLSAVNSMRVFRNRQHLSETEVHLDMIPSQSRRGSYDITAGFSLKF